MLTSSVGRVYLTYLPETLTGPVIQAEQESSPNPLSDPEIARITAVVRQDGVALTSGGVIPGVTSVAAPVFTAIDSLPLAVALALPARHATDEVLAKVTEELRTTTSTMSAELGHNIAASARVVRP
jgi:DNA-binding IclR family transcriptional regulator